MQLRPYQDALKQAVFQKWSEGHKRVLAVLPTGGGKTATKSSITKDMGVPTMAIAHRQELVLQISESLAAFGIQHKILAPPLVVKFCAARHIKRFGQSYTHGSDIMVASVQTLLRRQDRYRHHFGRIRLVDIDECFPAGTLVDGRPIESLVVGDMVTAFDEDTGKYHPRRVTAVMKNPMPQEMVRIRFGTHHVLTCTRAHPIWTKRGWVDASELTNDDEVLYVRGGSEPQPWCDEPLQDRLRSSETENRNRSGRSKPHQPETQGTGCEEGCVAEWERVDSVSILKRNDPDFSHDGMVYNIEVEGFHTYVADGVTVHNCHHVLPTNQWGQAFELFPKALGLGVTATPLRCDGQALDESFDTMVVGPTMRDLINLGFLTDYRIFCPPVSIDVGNIRISKSSGEYMKQDLIEATHRSRIVGDVVGHYLRLTPGQRGITFAVDRDSARNITQAYVQAGVPALYVDGDTKDKDRVEATDSFARGDTKVLVNVDLFGEGFDVPACDLVSMARPTQSYGLYVQQFGRGMRPYENKTHCTIIDHVGNVVSHGLPDAPRVWSLAGRKKQQSAGDEIPMTVCEHCMQPRYRTLKVCPFCGGMNTPQSRSHPEYVDGDLEELDPSVLQRMRGEVINVASGSPAIPYGATRAIVGRKVRDWNELCEAQTNLRSAMEMWGGAYHHIYGESDSEIQRRFFLVFGIDVLSAMALRKSDAMKLNAKIREKLT